MRYCTIGLAAFFFLCASAGANEPAGDFRPDPASVQRYGPAYRFPQAGWIVLHIEGKPYERGYQHGRLLAPEIAGYLRCFAAMLTPKAPAEGWKSTRRLANALFVRRFEKEFLEEMKGIADGASAAGARFDSRPIDLVDIVALNCWPEIETLDSALEATPTGLEGLRFSHPQPRAMPQPRPDHCSAFAATGPATADGKIVFGHITMFGLYPANFYNVWIDLKPEKGHRILMCAYPGAMQSGMDYYMNDAGLLIAETTISQTRFDIKGMTEASRIRQAIQYASNIDDAVAILKKDNNGLYTNEWLLGDINTNEIALFELGTHKSRLHRSSKKEWIGGTEGFYWGCNNTKDLELRLETVANVKGRPANVVFYPSDRDRAWQKLYHKHKGKIGIEFGKEAFTTPPIAAWPSLDAKFTTSDLARQLKSWALFGPPLGRTWHPTLEERKKFAEVKPLVSNPWTLLHANPPAKADAKDAVAVDLPVGKIKEAATAKEKLQLLNVPAWHGTLLPQTDGDIWLAAAFADYERIVAREKAMRARNKKKELTATDRDELSVALFAHQSAYQAAIRAGATMPLADIKTSLTNDHWYRLASGKGVMVLHELRQILGDPLFEETMDSFGKENGGKKVTTAQFRSHVEQKAKKSLAWFFDSRVKHNKPSPTLSLAEFGLSHDGFGGSGRLPQHWSLHGEIIQDFVEPASKKVTVIIETGQGEMAEEIELKGKKTEFTVTMDIKWLDFKTYPHRLILHNYPHSFPSNRAAFSIVSFHREQEQSLIVYGTGDEVAANREAAEALQKLIREKWSNITIPVKADKDVTEAELKTHHLVLIGRPDSNRLVQRFRADVPITFGHRSFVVRNKTYAHAGSAVVAAADNPLNKRYSTVVIAGLSAEATFHAPTLFMEKEHTAQVLVLPHGGTAQPLVLPGRNMVVELNKK
jgi:hypothetical protein